MLNNVCLCGRLVKDCQLEQAGAQSVKTRFTIAVNRDYKDRNGNTPCDFIDCEAWNAGANFLEEYARKGDMLSISGSLRKDVWTGEDDEYKSRVYINVNSVNIVGQVREREEEPEENTKKKPAPKKTSRPRR